MYIASKILSPEFLYLCGVERTKNVRMKCDYMTYVKYRDLCLTYLSTSASL